MTNGLHDSARPAVPSDGERWRQVQERLRLLTLVFDATCEGVVITDAQGLIVEVNGAFTALTGYSREQVLGRNPSMFASGRHDAEFYRAMWQSLRRSGQWSSEIWNRRADGKLIVELLRIQAMHSDQGALTHYVAVFSDVTASKRQQQDLAWLAQHDPLTGLPNRTLALDRLDVQMTAAEPHGIRLAVCHLDLDGFKAVNDHIGPARGDALMVAVAERIRHALRAADTVARLGGDDFVLLLGDVEDAAAVQATLQRVLQSLAQPYALGLSVSRVTASVGVALYPEHGNSPEQLLRAADQAMYRAKRRGGDCVCLAGDAVEPQDARQALLAELRSALAAEELCLHYQPKVCAHTRRVLGAEALVRWRHPQRGLLLPGEFLPAVAGTPLEAQLDLWVLRTALAKLCAWQAAGRPQSLSINVSPGTLLQPELKDAVAGFLNEGACGRALAPAGVELEVLETAALVDMEATGQAMQACAAQGVSFALDDFGTGYSSLSYLRRLPVNTLKIDRSFVANMLTDQGDLHIVRAVIGLAEAFGLSTVAEGVETEEHALALAALGCHQLQGWGIARAMPAPVLEAWLDTQAEAAASFGLGATGSEIPRAEASQ